MSVCICILLSFCPWSLVYWVLPSAVFPFEYREFLKMLISSQKCTLPGLCLYLTALLSLPGLYYMLQTNSSKWNSLSSFSLKYCGLSESSLWANPQARRLISLQAGRSETSCLQFPTFPHPLPPLTFTPTLSHPLPSWTKEKVSGNSPTQTEGLVNARSGASGQEEVLGSRIWELSFCCAVLLMVALATCSSLCPWRRVYEFLRLPGITTSWVAYTWDQGVGMVRSFCGLSGRICSKPLPIFCLFADNHWRSLTCETSPHSLPLSLCVYICHQFPPFYKDTSILD